MTPSPKALVLRNILFAGDGESDEVDQAIQDAVGGLVKAAVEMRNAYLGCYPSGGRPASVVKFDAVLEPWTGGDDGKR